MNHENLVSIIVLNYNAGELLLDCVESIKKSTYNNIEILVVDNTSSDKSHEICKDRFSELCILLNNDASRPVTVVMMLSAPLSVNLAGDLLISSAANLNITDLSWIIPLK